ncbi:MAG: 30S ribosomal protein S3, partial [Candidatus Hodarchaeota archaeon]
MPAKDHFISWGIRKAELDEYLAKELRRAGYGGVDVHKTPLGTRIILHVTRPGIVIGRGGQSIRKLTEILSKRFGLDNPQIEVDELEAPELNARIMADQLAMRLERGDHFRRAGYSILQRVMAAGAKGVEIVIKGKLTSQRGRYQKFRKGVISKAGEPAVLYVNKAVAHASRNPGITGVSVKIMMPDSSLPDEVKVFPPDEISLSPEEEKIEVAKEEEEKIEVAKEEEEKIEVAKEEEEKI